jgi:hypothetical protein
MMSAPSTIEGGAPASAKGPSRIIRNTDGAATNGNASTNMPGKDLARRMVPRISMRRCHRSNRAREERRSIT